MAFRAIELRVPRLISHSVSARFFGLMSVMLLLAQPVKGAGYYLPNQDALATAKGNAFIATADSAAAVHYNPAGLTQLQAPEIVVGIYSVQLGNEARVEGISYTPKSEWQAVPQAFYAHPMTDRITLGLGMTVPFGLGNDWGQQTPFRTTVTKVYLRQPSATVAVGLRATDQLSLGGSISLNYHDLELEQGLGLAPGDYLRFNGDGLSVSGALSLRWQPLERHAFGLIAASATSPRLEGKISSDLLPSGSAKLDFFTPLRIAAGYSFRPSPRWNIEANIEWLDWDALNRLDLTAPTLPSGVVPLVFNWKSNFIYEAGVSYRLDDGYVVAAGYDYNESAQPDATFNPGVSDANLHWLNAGVGRRAGRSSWFLTYQFGIANRTVSGNAETPAGQTANGRHQPRHHAVVFSWTRKL